jgi:hypothetical protein
LPRTGASVAALSRASVAERQYRYAGFAFAEIDDMHHTVEALMLQVPPPAADFRSGSWPEVEARLGLVLPDDYKGIIDIYGDYQWGDFLYLLNPFSENVYRNLFTGLDLILDAERELRAQFPEHYPLPLYPEAGGLLPFLVTDNGDTGFWITPSAPEKWPILLKESRAPEFEVHFTHTALFLYQFTGGGLQSLVFPRIVTPGAA